MGWVCLWCRTHSEQVLQAIHFFLCPNVQMLSPFFYWILSGRLNLMSSWSSSFLSRVMVETSTQKSFRFVELLIILLSINHTLVYLACECILFLAAKCSQDYSVIVIKIMSTIAKLSDDNFTVCLSQMECARHDYKPVFCDLDFLLWYWCFLLLFLQGFKMFDTGKSSSFYMWHVANMCSIS